ncbi:uncharacterized protein LOC144456674 [Phascolarctos cinereus]
MRSGRRRWRDGGNKPTHRRSWTKVAVNEHVGYVGRERRKPEKPRQRRLGCGVGWSGSSAERGGEGGQQRSCRGVGDALLLIPYPGNVGVGGVGGGANPPTGVSAPCRPRDNCIHGRPRRAYAGPQPAALQGRLGKGKDNCLPLPASSVRKEQSSQIVPYALCYNLSPRLGS